jgi:hypothetical protein
MTTNTLFTIVVGFVVVGFLAARQLKWSYVDRTSVWRSPGVLGIIGLFLTVQQAGKTPATSLDITLIVIGALVSMAIGAVMGRITTFRIADGADEKGRRVQSRTGGAGMGLWIALIAVRVGFDALGAVLGAHLVTSVGVILLTIAANRAAAALVMDSRLSQISHKAMTRA